MSAIIIVIGSVLAGVLLAIIWLYEKKSRSINKKHLIVIAIIAVLILAICEVFDFINFISSVL